MVGPVVGAAPSSLRVLPCGDAALLLELAGLDEVLSFHAAMRAEPHDGVTDLIPASRTLLVKFEPRTVDAKTLVHYLHRLRPEPLTRTGGEGVEIPVHYDGEDLEDVARITGLGVRGVIEAHTAQTWMVAFGGFAPGFGYLIGEDERLQVPRRSSPRTAVPPGAVGLAGEFSGVYPRQSPGGWQLIGHTEVAMWDIDRDPPALLSPGATVRFVEVSG